MKKKLEILAKQSRRYPFIAEHRGGTLTRDHHQKLVKWAGECAEHVLSLIEGQIDERLTDALRIAREWEDGKATTGEAMKASSQVHAVARETNNPLIKAIARSIGQAVATAHMADHSLGGAFYALKAVKLADKDIQTEREWQNKKLAELPANLIEIVNATWKTKELDRRV